LDLRGREGGTGTRRKLHSEELHECCSSSDVTRAIKWRRMRWAGHAARMGEMRNAVFGDVFKLLILGVLSEFSFIYKMCCAS
jgi:hypothetical protein